MKRALAVVVAGMLLCTCAPVTVPGTVAASFRPPATQLVSQDTSNHFVPRISFVGVVDGESVDEAILLLRRAVAAGAKAIVIEINSPGGHVNAGFLLARAIEDSPVPVACVVDGEAASMGFYLLQSCDVRLMTRRSVLMIHEPSFGGVRGTPEELRQAADALKAIAQAMAEHCAAKMKITVEELKARTDNKDWWMEWREALHVGAVDDVVTSVDEVVVSYRDHLAPP